MANPFVRFLPLVLAVFCISSNPPSAARPLRSSEVLALQAGGTLPANLVFYVKQRGLNFRPDDRFLEWMKQASADATVVSALKAADSSKGQETKLDGELLEKLSKAAVLMTGQHYDEAAAELNRALTADFANPETGFVMGELLRQTQDYEQAASVYEEVFRQDPGFPDIHAKLSYALCRAGDAEAALREAKLALAINHDNAEAHKNAGLALADLRKFDAAATEYKEALRIKPDYEPVRYDLGLLYYTMHQYDDSVVEYKKAIALDPGDASAHNNLAQTYREMGNNGEAIREFTEAKRLAPNDASIRQNLGSALMSVDPRAAIVELQELEKMYPDFEICHVCLGDGLAWAGDEAGARAEYQKAAALDPADADPHSGVGSIEEKKNNYAAALQEYRIAERLAPGSPRTHEDLGRVLLAQKDVSGAIAELKQAELLSPSSWSIHELYGQALTAAGQNDLAIAEFKEAVSLDPKQSHLMLELGSALEKKGDWVAALEADRKAALTQFDTEAKAQPGQLVVEIGPNPQKAYKAAQSRFVEHLASLRSAGKSAEAAELEKRVQMLESSAGTLEKTQAAMQAAADALKQGRMDEAEKGYKQAVELAEHLPPGDENLIVALGGLGNVYGMRQDYGDADAAFHRQLTIIEKTFGPTSPRAADPLFYLGNIAGGTGNFAAAQSYLSRALEINLKNFGENSPRTAQSLSSMAGFYMSQREWSKAEPYLLRAVKGTEQEDEIMLVHLWGLCDLYDRWSKPEKAQPCWHRATGIMEKQVGENGPDLATPLSKEANALRLLGRKSEADKLEERLARLPKPPQSN